MRPVGDQFPVTNSYGNRPKGIKYAAGKHIGVDYGCPIGTPVFAMWNGKVTSFNWGVAFGRQVIIDHNRLPNGQAGLWAGYMHLSKVVVKPGQVVARGQIIGYSGNTGKVSGPHLHVEVQKTPQWNAFRSVNPQAWINA